jgi:hypothetical protein
VVEETIPSYLVSCCIVKTIREPGSTVRDPERGFDPTGARLTRQRVDSRRQEVANRLQRSAQSQALRRAALLVLRSLAARRAEFLEAAGIGFPRTRRFCTNGARLAETPLSAH